MPDKKRPFGPDDSPDDFEQENSKLPASGEVGDLEQTSNKSPADKRPPVEDEDLDPVGDGENP